MARLALSLELLGICMITDTLDFVQKFGEVLEMTYKQVVNRSLKYLSSFLEGLAFVKSSLLRFESLLFIMNPGSAAYFVIWFSLITLKLNMSFWSKLTSSSRNSNGFMNLRSKFRILNSFKGPDQY